jgi:hemerythrin
MADRVEWSDDLATGIDAIDKQHKRLIDLYNDFEDAAALGKGHRHLDKLLRELIDYTAEHFTFEEQHLADRGYPELEPHRQVHRQLQRKLDRLRIEHQVNHRRVTGEMRRFLSTWLTGHILKHDLDYLPWVKGERPAADAAADPAAEPAAAAETVPADAPTSES